MEIHRVDDWKTCWAADHDVVRRNTTRRFRAIGDRSTAAIAAALDRRPHGAA